jgi:hypothetical protein
MYHKNSSSLVQTTITGFLLIFASLAASTPADKRLSHRIPANKRGYHPFPLEILTPGKSRPEGRKVTGGGPDSHFITFKICQAVCVHLM